MPIKLFRSLKALAPYGIVIYILGVAVRYGTGSDLGSVLAVIGGVLFASSLACKDQRPLESDRSQKQLAMGAPRSLPASVKAWLATRRNRGRELLMVVISIVVACLGVFVLAD